MKPHKNLLCWRKSFDLVKVIYTTTANFPENERYGLVSQMRRAAVSIPANIAEGAARRNPKEFRQFLYIALGSMSELDTLLLLSADLGFITTETILPLIETLEDIGKLIYGLIKKLDLT
ncbi:four helix bundle protein [Flavobacterium kingsejongi]|uniref:Four helix bundle protein n=1 Tax=Flavobacterium kingsejongi TaxID=1678728 RepID=A0A2S1LR46_9FLAO|nr:four helix bundle protein [Flavobacterium kingsejongi]AWG26116.1 hypothetical protein FK004_13205 [Flavobacterium kingsejongi]